MASENPNGSEQLWMPLPSLPRISVASCSRARLAHRRPISISLPCKLQPSTPSQSGGEDSESLNSSLIQHCSKDSLGSNPAPTPLSSLPPAAACSLGAADHSNLSAPACNQASSSAVLSLARLSLPESAENASQSSVNDDSVLTTSSSAPSGPFPCGSPVSAKPCDDSSGISNLNPHPILSVALPQSCGPVLVADAERQQEKSVEEIESVSLRDDSETQTSVQIHDPNSLFTGGSAFCEDENLSLAQSTKWQVNIAELSKSLGLDSEESEPEEGQLPGEWTGSDDSGQESNQNADEKPEDCATLSVVGEEGLTVAQIARLTWKQSRSGDKPPLRGYPTSDPASRLSTKIETAEKKRKKHKKGEGAKKRAREKSAQKYKEKKKQRHKANGVEQPDESAVAALGKGEQPETQIKRRNSVENVNQVPKSQGKGNSEKEAPEEGEITQPTQTSSGLLSALVEAEVGMWTTDDIDDQLMEQDVAVKKKRGPETAERMLKRKIAKRKKRAKKEKELGIRKRPQQKTLSKPPVKVLCTHYMKGRCAKGEKCEFSHDAIPLTKQEVRVLLFQNPSCACRRKLRYYQRELSRYIARHVRGVEALHKPCKFFMSHSCLKGDDCPFSHDLKAFPCKFFHTRGLCYDGSKCLFSHGPITEQEREKILKRVEKDKKERPSNVSGLDISTPNFSSSLPAEEDPDPLGWGTGSTCPSFDVDLQQRSPEAMDATPNYSVDTEYGDLPDTPYVGRSNWEIPSYSTVDAAEDVQHQSAQHYSLKDDSSEKLDHMDKEYRSPQHTTGSATTPEKLEANLTLSATDASAVSLGTTIFPTQKASLFVSRILEPRKFVPSVTQTTGSRKLTVESLLGEVLKQ